MQSDSPVANLSKQGKQDGKCGKCGKNVTEKAKPGLQCEYCGTWFHADCIGMSKDQYTFIKSFGQQFHWFCVECNPKAIEVLVLINKVEQVKDEKFEKNLRRVISEEVAE